MSVALPANGRRATRAGLPSGCRFHPRCPKRFEPCDQIDPELYPATEPAHEAACLLLSPTSPDPSPPTR
jgi:ABC-type dipeptide/oligopeptide/nickel transport system ATPase component